MKTNRILSLFASVVLFASLASAQTPAVPAAPQVNQPTTAPTAPASTDPKDVCKAKEASRPPDVLYLYSEINTESVKDITVKMENWAGDSCNAGRQLRIVMNSPGGSVIDAFALIDEISHIRAMGHSIRIDAYGFAASAAGFILQAADTRVIGANSMVMLHEISSGAQGQITSLKQSVEVTDRMQEEFIGIFVRRTHLTAEQIHDHIDRGREWWVSAQDAVKLGLADAVDPVPAYKPELPTITPVPAKTDAPEKK